VTPISWGAQIIGRGDPALESPVAAYAGLASILADCARREGELFSAIDAALGR
jgi:hypothetical protein